MNRVMFVLVLLCGSTVMGQEIRLAPGTWEGRGGILVTVATDGGVSFKVDTTKPVTVGANDDPIKPPPPGGELEKLRQAVQDATDAVNSRQKPSQAAALRTVYDTVGRMPVSESRLLQVATDAMYRLIPTLEPWSDWKRDVDAALKPWLDKPVPEAKKAWAVVSEVLLTTASRTMIGAAMQAVHMEKTEKP